MNKSTCSFPECNRPGSKTGYCYPHNRQRAEGRELKPLQKRATNSSREEAFFAKVHKGPECWEWVGPLLNSGYGAFWFDKKRTVAHRVSWELKNGSIPPGKVIDHMCWNRACCNPAHLRLASGKQNCENLSGALKNSTTGVRGVSWYERSQCFRAVVFHNGKMAYCKNFKTVAEAEAAVVEARNQLFTHNLADRVKA